MPCDEIMNCHNAEEECEMVDKKPEHCHMPTATPQPDAAKGSTVAAGCVPRDFVPEYEAKMQCNCDLDNWEPERITGHSHVCRIHRYAMSKYRRSRGLGSS